MPTSEQVGRAPPGASRIDPPSPFAAAIGWNIPAIVLGLLIAVAGLSLGGFVDTSDSAIRQTVAALWMLCGLVGLLIAAVGTLGATIAHAIKVSRRLASRRRDEVA